MSIGIDIANVEYAQCSTKLLASILLEWYFIFAIHTHTAIRHATTHALLRTQSLELRIVLLASQT